MGFRADEGLSLFKAGECADLRQAGPDIARGFLVACRHSEIMLDGLEETRDPIARGEESQVAGSFDLAV